MTVQELNKIPTDRVTTFSIKPTDTKSLNNLDELKKHCAKTGISFSFFMNLGIELVIKQIGIKKSTRRGKK